MASTPNQENSSLKESIGDKILKLLQRLRERREAKIETSRQ